MLIYHPNYKDPIRVRLIKEYPKSKLVNINGLQLQIPNSCMIGNEAGVTLSLETGIHNTVRGALNRVFAEHSAPHR